jgi:hypothetical protein
MIALAPVLGPSGIEVAESSLVQIDALIEGSLLGAGYRCVPRHEYAAIWDRIVGEMGGVFDLETGELDELKLEVARDQLRRDLSDMYHPDYLLHPEVWIVEAEHSAGVASWDGASQAVVGLGTRVLNVIDAILNQYDGFLEPGVVNALSLGIVVENMDGIEILQNAGGIEVLKDMERNLRDEGVLFEPVLADPKRNHRAVTTALRPLIEARTDKPPAG